MATIDRAREKTLAAAKSLEFVRDGMCLGLGSGSTSAIMVQLLAERIRQGLRVRGLPSSEGTRTLAQRLGIPLLGFDEISALDLTIDGADQATPDLHLIKGGGGALLREKVVASLSRRVIIVVDSTKWTDRLGAFPLPVEVVQFAWQPIAERIGQLGASPELRMTSYGQPFVTDEGNYILDCRFGVIEDPPALADSLNAMPGVMEHGLFVNVVDTLLVGRGETVDVIEAPCRSRLPGRT
jgi:ribose 5-phosphate isomerase A